MARVRVVHHLVHLAVRLLSALMPVLEYPAARAGVSVQQAECSMLLHAAAGVGWCGRRVHVQEWSYQTSRAESLL